MRFEFRCPRCASSHFGTSLDTGCCHGYVTRPTDPAPRKCGYTWSRVDSDWRCFVAIPESQREYAELRERFVSPVELLATSPDRRRT